MLNKKETLTKEQQDNIVIRIASYYIIEEIEFLSFTQNKNTGSYILIIKINNDESTTTTLLLNDLDVLDKTSGEIELSPIETFKGLKRHETVNNIAISDIKIKYIGDK